VGLPIGKLVALGRNGQVCRCNEREGGRERERQKDRERKREREE
jgi:hypothetical protein